MALDRDNRPVPGKYRVRHKGSILDRAEEGVAYVHEREYPVEFLFPTGRRATFCSDSGDVRIVGTEWLEMGDGLFESREAALEHLYGENVPALLEADTFLVVAPHEAEVEELPGGGARHKACDHWVCRVSCPRSAVTGTGRVLVTARDRERVTYLALEGADPWDGMALRRRVERSGLLRRPARARDGKAI